jgi:hypothetical protein
MMSVAGTWLLESFVHTRFLDDAVWKSYCDHNPRSVYAASFGSQHGATHRWMLYKWDAVVTEDKEAKQEC